MNKNLIMIFELLNDLSISELEMLREVTFDIQYTMKALQKAQALRTYSDIKKSAIADVGEI